MDFDWGNFGGGAISGAGTGGELGSIFGPAGTAIGTGAGALIGGILGGFGKKKPAPSYNDVYGNMISPQIQQLLNSHTGADFANRQADVNRTDAKESIRNFKNNQDFSGNAGVQAAYANKAMRQSESSDVDANLAGQRIDEANHAQGISAAQHQQGFDFQNYLDRTDRAQQPSTLQQILGNTLSTEAGKLVGGAYNDQIKSAIDPNGGDTNGSSVNSAYFDKALNNSPVQQFNGNPFPQFPPTLLSSKFSTSSFQAPTGSGIIDFNDFEPSAP